MRWARVAVGGLAVASVLCIGVAARGATPGASVTLVAGGDLSLSRYIGSAIRSRVDPKYPVRKVAARFAAADIAFANLEAPFSDIGPVTHSRDTLTFKNEPGTVAALTAMGLDVVSGANNHFWNAGAHGVTYSAGLLAQNGILLAGAGADDTAAHAPRILTRRGVRFAFLAYGYPDDTTVATATRPGIATAADIPRMQADVRKAIGRADVVIVSIHAGTEYTRTPTTFQRRFNRAAIDAGAAVVVGHHPHWVQRMERYRHGVILYSLGNLVFDQPWSWETRHGAVATITFIGSKLKRVRLTPVEIFGGVQPRFITGDTADAVISRLGIVESDLRFR